MTSKRKQILTQGCLAFFCMAMAAMVLIYGVKAVSKPIDIEETLDEDTILTYTGKAESSSPFGGTVTLEVVLDKNGKILEINIGENNFTEGIGTRASDKLPEAIIKAQSTDVDGVAMATISSDAIKAAVNDALSQAGFR